MIILKYNGRLGNRLFEYAGAYILSLKTGHKILEHGGIFSQQIAGELGRQEEYKSRELRTEFEPCPEGSDGTIWIKSYSDFIKAIESPDKNANYCMKTFLIDRQRGVEEDQKIGPEDLNTFKYRKEILDIYKCKEEKLQKNIDSTQAFIHARLGDTLGESNRALFFSFDCLRKRLKECRDKFSKVYISTDSPDHIEIENLIKEYDLTPYHSSPIETIIFGSQFNNLILSWGTFSFWIAYLSDAENISVYKNAPIHWERYYEYPNSKIKFYGFE